jgi:ubiquinol-cytochrome c reductase cytochrome b subunit
MLAAWPFLEPRLLRDRARHDLLDRPRDHPWRTAFGVAFFSWVALIFVAGAADRLFYQFGISYTSQVHLFRALTLLAPPVVFVAAKIACDELRRTQVRPGRGGPGRRVRRREDAGFDVLGDGR